MNMYVIYSRIKGIDNTKILGVYSAPNKVDKALSKYVKNKGNLHTKHFHCKDITNYRIAWFEGPDEDISVVRIALDDNIPEKKHCAPWY